MLVTKNTEPLQIEVDRLKQENEKLRLLLSKKPNPTAIQRVRQVAEERALELIEVDPEKDPKWFRVCKANLQRKITDDMKWELRIRYINDISDVDADKALEFIRNWNKQ